MSSPPRQKVASKRDGKWATATRASETGRGAAKMKVRKVGNVINATIDQVRALSTLKSGFISREVCTQTRRLAIHSHSQFGAYQRVQDIPTYTYVTTFHNGRRSNGQISSLRGALANVEKNQRIYADDASLAQIAIK